MFDEYFKKLKKLQEDVPQIFSKEAKNGALYFISKAVENTNKEHLVDTGNYKRNWLADSFQKNNIHGIKVFNNVEYATYLEFGHRLRNGVKWQGKFVGVRSLKATRIFVLKRLRKILKEKEKMV